MMEAKPVLPPSATPAADSMYVVLELTPIQPPKKAARESTKRTRPIPGTEPSSSARPASAAIPVTVPIVSKKSLSMTAKIVSRATTMLTLPKRAPYQSAWLKVANDGVGYSWTEAC